MLLLCGCAPVRALFSGHRRERFHGTCVGRPAVLDPVGWGTPPPTSPRAADRSGGRTPPPGLCVAEAVRKACTERVRACVPLADLAENRCPALRAIRAPTMRVEGAKGVLRERIGGAFASNRRGAGGARGAPREGAGSRGSAGRSRCSVGTGVRAGAGSGRVRVRGRWGSGVGAGSGAVRQGAGARVRVGSTAGRETSCGPGVSSVTRSVVVRWSFGGGPGRVSLRRGAAAAVSSTGAV